jgi:hypothetical protein
MTQHLSNCPIPLRNKRIRELRGLLSRRRMSSPHSRQRSLVAGVVWDQLTISHQINKALLGLGWWRRSGKDVLSLYLIQNQPAQVPRAVGVRVSVDATFGFV